MPLLETLLPMLLSGGLGIGAGLIQNQSNKDAANNMGKYEPLPTIGLQDTTSGKYLLESLKRQPTGVPQDIIDNINALLQTRGTDLRREAGANVASLGGATGTSGSPLLADMLSRQQRGISTDIGGQINQNLLGNELLKKQEANDIGQFQLGVHRQELAGLNRGGITTPATPQGTNPFATGALTGGNMFNAMTKGNGLNDLLNMFGSSKKTSTPSTSNQFTGDFDNLMSAYQRKAYGA